MAHRNILKENYPGIKKSEINKNFEEKVLKSFKIPKTVGNTYSSTIYTSLVSLLMDDDELKAGDRIGFFSYGSGSCAEFYSAIVLPQAKEYIKLLKLDNHLAARYQLSVEEFDFLASKRASYSDKSTFETDVTYPAGWFEKYYKNKGLLIFRGTSDFIRKYEWS